MKLKRTTAAILLVLVGPAVVPSTAWAVDCVEPPPPFPYPLERSDPLYRAALDEHRRYLEAIEDHVNCLERERAAAFTTFRDAAERFRRFFGDDAVLVYDEREGPNAATNDAAR